MYFHIALYKWKVTATEGDIESALNQVKSLEGKIRGIKRISWGVNTSKYRESYSHVILIEAESEAAVKAYRTHPDHKLVAAKIESMEDRGIGVDFFPR